MQYLFHRYYLIAKWISSSFVWIPYSAHIVQVSARSNPGRFALFPSPRFSVNACRYTLWWYRERPRGRLIVGLLIDSSFISPQKRSEEHFATSVFTCVIRYSSSALSLYSSNVQFSPVSTYFTLLTKALLSFRASSSVWSSW